MWVIPFYRQERNSSSPGNRTEQYTGGESVSEEKKQELQEMVTDLLSLPRDELLKAHGFVLGLKAQERNPG